MLRVGDLFLISIWMWLGIFLIGRAVIGLF